MRHVLHHGGLCHTCVHVRAITSARGSTFLLCSRAASDARYPKYPPQPVWACRGFEAVAETGAADTPRQRDDGDDSTSQSSS